MFATVFARSISRKFEQTNMLSGREVCAKPAHVTFVGMGVRTFTEQPGRCKLASTQRFHLMQLWWDLWMFRSHHKSSQRSHNRSSLDVKSISCMSSEDFSGVYWYSGLQALFVDISRPLVQKSNTKQFFAQIFQLFPVEPHCGMLQHKF